MIGQHKALILEDIDELIEEINWKKVGAIGAGITAAAAATIYGAKEYLKYLKENFKDLNIERATLMKESKKFSQTLEQNRLDIGAKNKTLDSLEKIKEQLESVKNAAEKTKEELMKATGAVHDRHLGFKMKEINQHIKALKSKQEEIDGITNQLNKIKGTDVINMKDAMSVSEKIDNLTSEIVFTKSMIGSGSWLSRFVKWIDDTGDYLSSLLNSPAIAEPIKKAQDSGLLQKATQGALEFYNKLF